MHSYSIKDLWDLPERSITATTKINHQIFIDVMPIKSKQACPICAFENTSRRGIGYVRKVRHLEAFGWPYECVAPKKRYTKAFEATLPKQAIGATITTQKSCIKSTFGKKKSVIIINYALRMDSVWFLVKHMFW